MAIFNFHPFAHRDFCAKWKSDKKIFFVKTKINLSVTFNQLDCSLTYAKTVRCNTKKCFKKILFSSFSSFYIKLWCEGKNERKKTKKKIGRRTSAKLKLNSIKQSLDSISTEFALQQLIIKKEYYQFSNGDQRRSERNVTISTLVSWRFNNKTTIWLFPDRHHYLL